MVDPSLVITIDRTALSLAPLVFSAAAGTTGLGITAYQEPAMQARVDYAPASRITHGEVPLGAAWQQSLLPFSFATFVDTEAESRVLVAEVAAAIMQGPTFPTTVTMSGAPAETWSCNPGSLTPGGGRSWADMKHARPTWAVALPCYPIRSIA